MPLPSLHSCPTIVADVAGATDVVDAVADVSEDGLSPVFATEKNLYTIYTPLATSKMNISVSTMLRFRIVFFETGTVPLFGYRRLQHRFLCFCLFDGPETTTVKEITACLFWWAQKKRKTRFVIFCVFQFFGRKKNTLHSCSADNAGVKKQTQSLSQNVTKYDAV